MEFNMIVKAQKFVDKSTNKEINYNQVYLVIGKKEIAIKPIFKDDKKVLIALVQASSIDK